MILPRLLKIKDVLEYLRIDVNKFNNSVRPYLTEIPVPYSPGNDSSRGVRFDRLELDAWLEQYKRCNGPAPEKSLEDMKLWAETASQELGTTRKRKPTSSIKLSEERDFTKELNRVLEKKLKK
jgi:hypothetical protein